MESEAALLSAIDDRTGVPVPQVLASFAFEGYGDVVVQEGEPRVAEPSGTWAEWLSAYGQDALVRLPAEFDDLRPGLRTLFADPDVDARAPARLYPWDLRPGNALTADGTVTAVLDWESPLAAVSALPVAKTAYLVADWYVEDADPLRRAFREGTRQSDRIRPSAPSTARRPSSTARSTPTASSRTPAIPNSTARRQSHSTVAPSNIYYNCLFSSNKIIFASIIYCHYVSCFGEMDENEVFERFRRLCGHTGVEQ